jgi:hypothetical protein
LTLLSDAETRNAFLQITRAAPIETMPYFAAMVASSSFRQGELKPPQDGECRRLNKLEDSAPERIAGQLPSLFGKVLDPSHRAIHVAASLDPLEIAAEATAFDWPRVRRRIDMLGRLERAGCGTLSLIRPFVQTTVGRHGSSMAFQEQLLRAMAAAFPAFESREDGVWRRKTFEPFEPFVEALLKPELRAQSLALLGCLSGSDITPQIVLMLLHYGIPSASLGNPPTFDHFRAIVTNWVPPSPWPISYLVCIGEIAQEIGAHRGCDAHRALLYGQFSEFLRLATIDLEDDPLNQSLIQALVVPPLTPP